MSKQRRLGLNIDHIATLRQARRSRYPDPVEALPILKACKVDQVTLHLREDRRHIQDRDLIRIVQARALPVNMELAVTDEMIELALKVRPTTCTFVPERREEITTEGGLDCYRHFDKLKYAIRDLRDKKIRTSLFVDPENEPAQLAKDLGAEGIELHTGSYCEAFEAFYAKTGHYDLTKNARLSQHVKREIERIHKSADFAHSLGLKVYAGHGLHADNLAPIVTNDKIEEYNIGHAVIARSVFVGLKGAIREIQKALKV